MRALIETGLLPEDDESLKAEIAYALRTGRVVPYALPPWLETHTKDNGEEYVSPSSIVMAGAVRSKRKGVRAGLLR